MRNDFKLEIGAVLNDKDINEQLKVISKKEHLTLKVDVKTDEISKLKTVTTKATDEVGKLYTITEKFNKEEQSLGHIVTDVTEKFDKKNKTVKETSKTLKDNTENLKKATNSSKSLGQTFAETTEKVFRFGLSTKIISGVQQAIVEAKDTIFEFDGALTEFKKVSDLSGESLNNYTEKLGIMGEEVARTRTEMLESATMFKKTGYSEEDSAQLAKIAELYKNIADTEVDSGQASSFLVSQMKSFNITADDSIKILDAMNAISNNMAVGTNDLEMALRKSGSALGTLGNSFNETIALVESGTSIMQGQASKVGKGLRSIGIELSKMATKSEYLTDASGQVSVAFRDENGELKNTYQILNDLSPQWEKLNNEQKTQLAQAVAGKLYVMPFIDLINEEEEAQQQIICFLTVIIYIMVA